MGERERELGTAAYKKVTAFECMLVCVCGGGVMWAWRILYNLSFLFLLNRIQPFYWGMSSA